MRSRGPSLAGRSETEDADRAPLQDATYPTYQSRSVTAAQKTGSGAPSADWQSHFCCRAALSGSCPPDTEGAKGAKVGHLAQGKHLPPLWSSGGELQGSSSF